MNTHSNRQQGFSLVELMVTLVISLVAIISILSLFQGITRNSVEVKVGARLDGQVQLGLLTAHKLLQGAGFSTATDSASPSYGTDLLLVSGAALNETGALGGSPVTSASLGTPVAAGTGWALLWISDGTLAGLYAPAAGGLFTLNATGGTTPLTVSGNSWQTGTTLITPPSVGAPNLVNAGRVGMTLASSDCQPPGMAAEPFNTGGYTVTITANGYAAGAAQVSTTCLTNF